MKTEVNELGRVFVINEVASNEPQAYTVCVKNSEDWLEVHNFIINENEIDGIPNRRITCISPMNCSSKRSVYEMSQEEAEILRQNEKVDWVVLSSMHNPIVLEQRKYDEEFDRLIDTNRFKQNITNLRTNSDPGGTLNFTQWGLSRHSKSSNTFVGVNTSSLSEDIASLNDEVLTPTNVFDDLE